MNKGIAETNPSRRRVAELVALAAVMLLALLLRHQRAGWDVISLDEMWHLALSTGRGSPQITLPRDRVLTNVDSPTDLREAPRWHTVWTHVERAVHPPLYLVSLRLWREVFGVDDLAAQWLSVACSLASIVLLWLAARLSFGTSAAMVAAIVMAVSPTQLIMSQEVRGYPMLMMWGCLTLYAAAGIEKFGVRPWRLAMLAAGVLAMMLTHYFAIGACVAIAIWVLIRTRGRQRLLLFSALAGTAVVYMIVWGPWIFRQISDAQAAAETWLAEPSTNGTLLALLRFGTIPLRLVADPDLGTPWWALSGVVLLAAPLLPAVRRREQFWLWWLWLVCTIGFIAVLDITRSTRHLSYLRYTLLASPAAYALLAALLSLLRPAVLFHAAAAAVVAVTLLLTPTAYFADAPDYRVLQRYLRQTARPDDVFVFFPGDFVKWHNEVLMLASSGARELWPRTIVMMDRPADADLAGALSGRRVCVMSGPLSAPIQQLLPGAQLLEQRDVVDANQRHFAVCTWVQMP